MNKTILDLYNKQYDRETLKKYIYFLKLIDILKTQKIDITFAVRYILNTKYQLHEEDQIITSPIVLKYQTHITYDELQKELLNYESDDDSIEDFEKYSSK
jgi:HJR/Mrr/RecB family endonuclease